MLKIIGILLVILGILTFMFGDIYLLVTAILDLIQNGTANLFWDITKLLFREVIAGIVAFILVVSGYVILIKD
jgi:hypothetical protein